MATKNSIPLRIDPELFAAARAAAPTMSRSTSQQISHWARIGRELEGSPEVSMTKVGEVLRGEHGYDALSGDEQAVVRTYWRERMDALAGRLDLARDFAASGLSYVELDERGKVVRREPLASQGERPPAVPGRAGRAAKG